MTQGDLHLHNYQDDLDNAEDKSTVDDFTHQQTGELSEDTGVSKQALDEELGKLDTEKYENSGMPTADPAASDPSAADPVDDLEGRDEDGDEKADK